MRRKNETFFKNLRGIFNGLLVLRKSGGFGGIFVAKQNKNHDKTDGKYNPSSRPIIIGHFERSSASREISPAHSNANKNFSLRVLSEAKNEKP
ncbi:MAG: hypothetical protein M0Q45_03925 [Bacteroidales bacterium]|nr:hypothetical protein [Bacteroidales bacterium]MDY0315038.1 hypothetical protein [Bacteroidales bacterium]